MEGPKILDQHRWLMQFVGEWTVECDGSTGTESVVAMGENWIVGTAEWMGEPMGGMKSTMVVGYDDAKGKFVGSWAGTMLNMVWVYEGDLEGNRLTLNCEGPNFDGTPGMSNYRDIYIIDEPNRRRLVAEVQDKDGNWTQFMETRYVRAV